MTLKELMEKRAGLIESMKAIVERAKSNEDGKMTTDEYEEWSRMNDDVDALTREKEIIEKQDRLNREIAERKEVETKKEPNEEEREAKRMEAFKRYLVTGDKSELRADGQSVGTDADGGYTVPQTWANMIEEAMLAYGSPLDWATVVTTSSGEQINYPTVNDTSTRSAIVAEEGSSSTGKKAFSTVALGAYTLRTDIIPISIELLQDSAYNMEATIAKILAENDARGLNYYCTVGTGSSQHNGIATAATLGENAAASTLTVTDLLNLKHSVDPAYRKNGKWMFNDATLKYIKLLTIGSSDDRPLWQPSYIVGEPDTIDGDQYIINQDVVDIGTSSRCVLYGDFSKYLVRRVGGYSLVRFNEYYMSTLQIGLMGFSRSDGELLDAGTNPVKYILNAAS